MAAEREDWKLWLTLKDAGLHGTTLPEVLFWHRIKETRRDWDFLGGRTPKPAVELTAAQFPTLAKEGWANPTLVERPPGELGPFLFHLTSQSSEAPADDACRHVVVVLPRLALHGPADRANVAAVEALAGHGWPLQEQHGLRYQELCNGDGLRAGLGDEGLARWRSKALYLAAARRTPPPLTPSFFPRPLADPLPQVLPRVLP
jgi:hypothetical protein